MDHASRSPLTSRVYVNRIWGQLFGQGLVSSFDNFGTTGEAPSHPELLDHLANEFLQNRTSTKRLIRQIVMSRAYRQSAHARAPEASETKDPDRRWLSSYPTRRLTAEELRDSVLFASSDLDLSPVEGVIPVSQLRSSSSRTVYLPVQREEGLHPLLEAFDFADPNLSTGRRNVTNLPTQSLYLMNSPLIAEKAKGIAKRTLETNASVGPEQLDGISWRILGRPLNDAEHELFRGQMAAARASSSREAKVAELTPLIHAMFCSPEFRFIE